MTAYSSIPASKRIQILDILRGIALLGILIANANDYRLVIPSAAPNFNELNTWFNNIIIAIAEGSFYPLFSLLFGVGFAIWMDRSMKHNGGVWRFAWRSFILFLFGCLFYTFVEDRHILIRYSILSLPLLCFYKARPKTLMIAAVLFLLLVFFHKPIWTKLNGSKSEERKEQIKLEQQVISNAWDVAEKNKDYKSFVRARAIEMPGQIKTVFTFSHPSLPLIVCMFLLGVYCWRRGLLTQTERYVRLWKKIFWVGLTVGVGGNIFVFVIRTLAFKKIYIPKPGMLFYVETICNPALTFFYVSLFVITLQKLHSRSNFLLKALNAAGRIPLTNYFIQYLVMTILMMPYGFGLDHHLFSQHLLLVAFSVFVLQVLFSIYWMKHFLYGPMEWLWRSLTYMKFQSLKRKNKKILSDQIELID